MDPLLVAETAAAPSQEWNTPELSASGHIHESVAGAPNQADPEWVAATQKAPPEDLDTTSDPAIPTPSAEADLDTVTPAGSLPQGLNDSLARLEMNSLQVKLYLDSIDEKIARMEPRLESIQGVRSEALPPIVDPNLPEPGETARREIQPNAAPPSPPWLPFTEEASAPESAAETETETDTDRRRRKDDLAGRRRPFLTASPPQRPSKPLSSRPWIQTHWLGTCLALLGVAALIIFAHWMAGPDTSTNTSPSASLSPQPVPHAALPAAATPPLAAPNSAHPDSSGPSKAAAGTPLPSPSQISPAVGSPAGTASLTTSAPSPDAAQPDSSPSLRDPSTGTSTPSDVAVSDSPPSLPAHSSTTTYGKVHVSSGVMAGNLIYSRQPSAPGGLAALFRTEGKVTMQAIISRKGHVDNLRVLSGHRLLRGAAKDAVRTWRYRPYLINGVPVEVATIISVEFKR